MNWNRLNRKTHYWGSFICALPILVVCVSGILLLLKKDVQWIQPPSARGEAKIPTISFDEILDIAQKSPEAEIKSWEDISRLDVRPSKGIIKIRSKNSWELQIDHQSGKVLKLAYRRSDLIESLHDGTFFHDKAKLWIFLPAGAILLFLWFTGMYLFLTPFLAKRKSKKKKLAKAAAAAAAQQQMLTE